MFLSILLLEKGAIQYFAAFSISENYVLNAVRRLSVPFLSFILRQIIQKVTPPSPPIFYPPPFHPPPNAVSYMEHSVGRLGFFFYCRVAANALFLHLPFCRFTAVTQEDFPGMYPTEVSCARLSEKNNR